MILPFTACPPGPPPWDYAAIAREYAAEARTVLDLGTGGGEVFSRIVPGLQGRTVASEEWVVNAPVARDRLAPLGVDVVRADSLHPPFADATFGLALSRHEAIDPPQIDRILRPGGVFVTQQVAKRNWQELSRFFPTRTRFGDHFKLYGDWFRIAGYDVETREHQWPLAYAGIGEVAYMLLARGSSPASTRWPTSTRSSRSKMPASRRWDRPYRRPLFDRGPQTSVIAA